MAEDSALPVQIHIDGEEKPRIGKDNGDGGWELVSYQKRSRRKLIYKQQPPQQQEDSGEVSRSIKQHFEDRRRRIVEGEEEQKASGGEESKPAANHKRNGYSEADGDKAAAGGVEADEATKKKLDVKKPKKVKVTVAEAAGRIDAGDLRAFLANISEMYEMQQQDIQLIRFADYFGRAFAQVNSAQFPWLKIFKDSTVAKLAGVPLSHVSGDVFKTAVDWLGMHSDEALCFFVLWAFDNILADPMPMSQPGAGKGPKKGVQQSPPKSKVAIFVVLAMTLRERPDVLTNLLPVVSENPKLQGQDKIPVIVWAISQASQGDLSVGLYLWIRALLPLLGDEDSGDQHSRDLVLQLVERILSSSGARAGLLNGAVKRGERLVPPSALELLMRVTFPVPSAHVKATERLLICYPILKEFALAGASGGVEVVQQIMNFAFKAAGEGASANDLAREAAGVLIWCLAQNSECYQQWDMHYLDNLEASVMVLRKLSDEWEEYSLKHPTLALNPLKETLKSFRQKNKKELEREGGLGHQALLKDADKYCKVILGRLAQSEGWMRSIKLGVLLFLAVLVALISHRMLSVNNFCGAQLANISSHHHN